MLDFDLVNSFHHLRGMLFNYITAGTTIVPDYKSDIVTQTVGDRGILEFNAKFPGQYLIHTHQSELTKKGWIGSDFKCNCNISIVFTVKKPPHQYQQ